jgi:3-deoxy-7-phosphoheptulonate synthase
MTTFNFFHSEILPTPQQIHDELQALPTHTDFIENARCEISRCLDGSDDRLLIIVGPCSIHDVNAAKEYAQRLLELSKEVKETCLLIMRVYFEKPRTSFGWKGFVYDPFLDNTHDLKTGIRWTRKLLLDIAEMGIPTAAEFLDPSIALYFSDLLSWGCVGARTASSQIHRQMASGLPMPVAIKNNTDGNIGVAVNGVISATSPHSFVAMNMQGQLTYLMTSGNAGAHIVLRGGENKPNYDRDSVAEALKKLAKANLPLRLIVDCSHDNSRKQHEEQIPVFESVLSQYIEGNRAIRGMILESNLHEGNQNMGADPIEFRYSVSVTDPCIDWSTTENLIRRAHQSLQTHSSMLKA